jgi:hypothetical protein
MIHDLNTDGARTCRGYTAHSFEQWSALAIHMILEGHDMGIYISGRHKLSSLSNLPALLLPPRGFVLSMFTTPFSFSSIQIGHQKTPGAFFLPHDCRITRQINEYDLHSKSTTSILDILHAAA